MEKQSDEKILNIPNMITATRLLLMIPCIGLGIAGNIPLAGIYFILAVSTDGIDGFVARKLNQTTKFGAKFDAIVDKVIMFGVLPMVIIEAPFIMINLVYELAIACLNGYSHQIKRNQPHTSQLGRKKQVLLCILLASGYLKGISPIINMISNLLIPITAIVQHQTFRDYLNTYKTKERQKKIDDHNNNLSINKTTDQKSLNKVNEINPLKMNQYDETQKLKTIGPKKINHRP